MRTQNANQNALNRSITSIESVIMRFIGLDKDIK